MMGLWVAVTRVIEVGIIGISLVVLGYVKISNGISNILGKMFSAYGVYRVKLESEYQEKREKGECW